VQKGLHERAVLGAARAERPGAAHAAAQVHRVVGEMQGGQSPVLVVEGQDGRRLAVKLVQMTSGQLTTCPVSFPSLAVNVFPVLDVFAWEDGYGLVMPVAELSLRQWLSGSDECPGAEETLAVLQDVARALASIDGKMVHGDLKPENILRHESAWCLADFGPSSCRLSRSQRGEYSLTPAYAAPE
jgi:serine/threonine protein kinase